ncbi:glycogen synthase [candidate division FCPU426 bacterium]|nr:glycogen synthase [candidate division FCPU426 bacterium]
MRVSILTNEYPPNVYGGAGVHVEYLANELARLDSGKHSVQVLCFGNQRKQDAKLSVQGINNTYDFSAKDLRHGKFLDTMLKDIVMSGHVGDIDIIHCHTWYSHFAGLLAKQLHGVPLVLTTHSLEPHRPWKMEQLGSAYYASSWIEKVAYENADGVIAVSEAMKNDVHALYGVPVGKIRVIHNGIDINEFKPTPDSRVLDEYRIEKATPFILFVGRITRQKGIIHLVNAIKHIHPGVQIVLCAGAPDTKEIGQEMKARVEEARRTSKNRIIWIAEMVPKAKLIALYSQAAVFVCPSVYEPFGIINLEAMACQTPVVATAVGGILEVVIPAETGVLVPIQPKSAREVEPADPEKFARDLAEAVNALVSAPDKIKAMGAKARQRVIDYFSWPRIAAQTMGFYQDLVEQAGHAKSL